MVLIDWEYCGNNDPIWDLVTLSIEAEFTSEQVKQMFLVYFSNSKDDHDERAQQRYIVYKAVYALWAVLWAQVQLANANHAFTKEDLIEMIKKRTNEYDQTIASDEYKNAFNAIKSKNNIIENSKVSSSNSFKK